MEVSMRKALIAFSLAGFLLGGVNAALACEGEDGKDCHCKHKGDHKKDSKKDDKKEK
jgi:hypothetical protein